MSYIKLDRKLLDWEWYGDSPTLKLWIHILLKANWETKQWRNITIKSGSFVTSLEHLAIETGLSKKQIRRALDNLESTKEITTKRTHQGTMIKVEKWALFQCKEEDKGTRTEANKARVRETKRATTKEYKNTRNKEYSCCYSEKAKKELSRFEEAGYDISKIKTLVESAMPPVIEPIMIHEAVNVMLNDNVKKPKEYLYQIYKNKGWVE